MKSFIRVWGLPIFLLAGFFVFTNAPTCFGAGFVIDHDTTWNKGNVIIVSADTENAESGVDIMPGVTLTVNPGVIIKLAKDNGFAVGGNLIIKGTADDPVIITSLNDDSAGGDTNGDGNATTPTMGDWSGIISNEPAAKIQIDYATIKYGGGYRDNPVGVIMMGPQAGEFKIDHSSIIDNDGQIMTMSANFVINNSNIYNPDFCQLMGADLFCGTMIINNSGQVVDLKNNYWGHADGPTVSIMDVNGTFIMGLADYQPFLTSKWLPPPTGPDPVIIIPGILGSWEVKNQLGFNEWKIDPILHVYDNLMEAMIAAGYKEHIIYGQDRNLFTFPYDWRVDNNITAELLKQKIQEVKGITGKSKVDLVAHSMGGIVARAYIEGANYQNDVDQLIFLGTPHLGSPEAYPKYEGASFLGFREKILEIILRIEAVESGYLDLIKYIRDKIPTIQQLLPVYDYLQDKQNNIWQDRIYPTNYPRSSFLENLNTPENLNLLKQRVNIANIFSGSDSPNTLSTIRVVPDPNVNDNKWQNGYPENLTTNQSGLIYSNGDGTVPLSSANSLAGVETIETNNKEHLNLPTTMQQEVIEELTGHRPESYFNNKITAAIKRWSLWRVYSPVDFMVTAPDGKMVGKNFTNNTEINQIDDAFYSGFDGESEFVLIPNPAEGEYHVQLQGVEGGGEYTLAASFINDDLPSDDQELAVKSQILAGAVDSFTVNFSNDNSQPAIESDIDFKKLIALTNLLYQQGEIKKVTVKNLLVNAFERLGKKYDKIIDSKNKKQKRLQKVIIKLELKVIDQILSLYGPKQWLTPKAKDILVSNINLLINKL